ncbi:hypothetical protein C0J52_05376 [Blattella germanica]|nr:hypothetical protein C0J52_05376 [Blattella germanica]
MPRHKKWSLCHMIMSLSEDTIIVSSINFTNFLYGRKKETSSPSGTVELSSLLAVQESTKNTASKFYINGITKIFINSIKWIVEEPVLYNYFKSK